MATPRKQAAKRTSAKRGVGRPSRCTPELAAAICETIAQGTPTEAAARLHHLAPSTLYLWRQKADPNHPNHHARYLQFSESLTRAEDERVRVHVDSVRAAGLPHPVVEVRTKEVLDKFGQVQTLTETVEREEWDWRASLELLARWDPAHFGKREALELSGANGGPVEIAAAVRPVSGEEQLATMQALEDAGKIPEGSTVARREVLRALGQV